MRASTPTYCFTIPSIHDDTPLDCRLYQPSILSESSPFTGNGAIIAHPYAPLGGCYDDHVVETVTDRLLESGYVVGTFNFRGAAASKSKTSWSGRGELEDYISFAGFVIFYLHYLFNQKKLVASPQGTLATIAVQEDRNTASNQSVPKSTLLVFGGYSYGSLIVENLPTAQSIISIFNDATKGSAAAEIVLRAKIFAAQTTHDLEVAEAQGRQLVGPGTSGHGNHSLGLQNPPLVTVGGEETPSEERRRSHEVRHSGERMRSLDIPRSIAHKAFRRKSGEVVDRQQEIGDSIHEHVPTPCAAYLLISPLQPPLTGALATSLGHRWGSKQRDVRDVLVGNSTLAIWGNKDFFTSSRKLNIWAEKMEKESGGRFKGQEVLGGGHFWREEGVLGQLCDAIDKWILTIDAKS